MAKILMVVAPEGYQNQEYSDTRTALEQAGHRVVTGSTEPVAKGSQGGSINVDVLLSDISMRNYDAVVFIGGPGSLQLADNNIVTGLARECFDSGKVIAAICAAPTILANAGILKDKKATWHESQTENLRPLCRNYTGAPVQIDKTVITADGPDSATEFGKAIAQVLKRTIAPPTR